MVAYVIAIREQTLDAEKFKEYAPKGIAAFEGVNYTARAGYGRFDVLEGAEVEGVAIIEFPSFEEAQNWYNGPAYQEALALRRDCSRFHIMIVEGM